MKLLASIILCFIIAGNFTACAVNKQRLNEAQSDFIAFNADGSFILSDPPSDKARIYFYRDNGKVGAYLGYTIRIIYAPRLNANSVPNYDDYQDSLGYLASGKTFFADIYAGHQVAIMAKTGAMSYIVFTPQKGKIYCIKGDMKNGLMMPSPNIVFVSKNVCEDAWIDYFKAENLDFQNQWRKVYNERGDRILSENPFAEKVESKVDSIESKSVESKSKESKLLESKSLKSKVAPKINPKTAKKSKVK